MNQNPYSSSSEPSEPPPAMREHASRFSLRRVGILLLGILTLAIAVGLIDLAIYWLGRTANES